MLYNLKSSGIKDFINSPIIPILIKKLWHISHKIAVFVEFKTLRLNVNSFEMGPCVPLWKFNLSKKNHGHM